MDNKKKITENVMILEFLMAEIDSTRFRNKLNQAMQNLNVNIELITKADLKDLSQNQKRKELLKLCREYENDKGLFEGFPREIIWYEAEIRKEELLNQVYYIEYDYWDELTDGSRLPKDAAKNIKEGKTVFNVSNDNFLNASNDFKNGKTFYRLILVSDYNKIVVLEGHLRITVYAMNAYLLPETIPVIIGYSNEMNKWECF